MQICRHWTVCYTACLELVTGMFMLLFAVAIPLVNPQLELLPVHFATDPGHDYDWKHADECNDFDLPTDRKVRLIECYMDVKVRALPENPKRMEAFDRLTHRRHGSLDSALITSMVGSGKPEEERKQGPAGVSRQIHGAVVKTFGSLGQSVSQTLKNIAHGSKSNKVSIGTATQSSRTNTLTVQMLSNRHQVLQLPLMIILLQLLHCVQKKTPTHVFYISVENG